MESVRTLATAYKAKEKTAVLTTVSFYGKKTVTQGVKSRQKWALKLEKREEDIQKATIPNPYKFSLQGPTSQWNVFFSQKDAFQFSKQYPQDLHVFAYESKLLDGGSQGKRMYLTASYHQFWHYYRQLTEEKRLHYEIIPEGAVCKLYFDLEFNKKLNPTKDGDVMVNSFIKYVCYHLEAMFDVHCDRTMVLDLDASTTEKFSCHLIFQMPGAIFRNNIHAGNFVRKICKILLDIYEERNGEEISNHSTEISDYAEKNTKDYISIGSCQSETQVSCKKQKLDSLGSWNDKCSCSSAVGVDVISSEHTHGDSLLPLSITELTVRKKIFPGKSPGEHSVFICDAKQLPHFGVDDETSNKKHPECTMKDYENSGLSIEELLNLLVFDKHKNVVLFCDMAVYTKNRNFRLYLSSKYMKKNPLELSGRNQYKSHLTSCSDALSYELFLDSLINNVRFSSTMKILNCENGALQISQSRPGQFSHSQCKESDTLEGYSHSPYPDVDDFISSCVIKKDGVVGHIRRWAYFSQGEILTYDIGRYRWCHNVQRQHRSNNIMIIADLKQGVYYQKCHDPECRAQNFRSQNFPLPQEVLPAGLFQDNLDTEEVNDIELIKAGTEAEQLYYTNHDTHSTQTKQYDNDTMAYIPVSQTPQENTQENSVDGQQDEISDADLMLAEIAAHSGKIGEKTLGPHVLDLFDDISDTDLLAAFNIT